jgi:hypothetical protein
MEKVGDPSDVANVNPNTAGYMTDLTKMIQGLQGASDPLAAFMGALPNLFGSAINMSNPYTSAVDQYRTAASQSVRENALETWANTPYGSGPASAVARAFGEFETGLGKDIIGMQTNLGNSLAGYGANLLNQQTGLLGQLMGYQGQMAAPEWWQPTYMEKNTVFGDIMGALGPIAGIASMFIPGMQGVGAGLLASSLTGASSRPAAENRYADLWAQNPWGSR